MVNKLLVLAKVRNKIIKDIEKAEEMGQQEVTESLYHKLDIILDEIIDILDEIE